MKQRYTHYLAFLLIFLLTKNSFSACELYEIDFLNNQLSGPTYNVSCADNVTPSQWRVSNNTCSLTTTPVTIPGDSGTFVSTPLSVTINRTGNLGCNDWVKIEYSIDGVWYTQDSINACDMSSNQQTVNFNVICGAQSVLGVRVTMSTTNKTEKWFIRDADVCISQPSLILPIMLLSLNATPKKGEVHINWATATEYNNDYFTVERSSDGESFEFLANIKGAINSINSKNYLFVDLNPDLGFNYYRLKQTNLNGTISYSNIISAKVSLEFGNTEEMKIFPNPCESNVFNLSFPNCKEKEVLVVVTDAMGKEMFSKVILEEEENQFTAIDTKNKLLPGVYLVIGSSQDKLFKQKLVIR